MNQNEEKNIKLDSEHPYTTCPECGRGTTEANDAGNGFCIECTQNGSVD